MTKIQSLSFSLACLSLVIGCASTEQSGTVSSLDPTAGVTRVDESFSYAKKAQVFPHKGNISHVLAPDEFMLNSKWHLKLGGIDSPVADSQKRVGNYYGKPGMDFSSNAVLGKIVKIKYDEFAHDSSGRLLGYVTTLDGTYLNAKLVESGFALTACRPPNNKDCSLFAQKQQEAVTNRRGIWSTKAGKHTPSKIALRETEHAIVRGIVDGDTVVLDDNRIVRLIGIDAPENNEMYKRGSVSEKAYEYLRRLVQGKEVELEFDIELVDPRERDLAYVYVKGKHGRTFVNAELVRQGLAWVAIFPPNIVHIGDLFAAQTDAVKNQRGIWNTQQK